MAQGYFGPGEDGGDEAQILQTQAPFEYLPRVGSKDIEVSAASLLLLGS